MWSYLSFRKVVNKTTAMMNEMRLLYQGFLTALPCILMMTFHHLVRFPFVEYILGGGWCVLNGPVVYLWFNTDLRMDFFELYGLTRFNNALRRQATNNVNVIHEQRP